MAKGRAQAVSKAEPVDGPWPLPEGWRWASLGSLGTWFGGGTPSKAKPEYWTGGTIPWVSPKDMKKFRIESTADAITQEALAASAARLVPSGSVLCVMRSGILQHTFPVAVNAVDVTLNQDMRALHPFEVDPIYLHYALRSREHDILASCSKQGTTVSSIEASRLDRIPVPVAPLEVQQRLVARIDELIAEVDDGKAALTQAQADLALYRTALVKAAVTGELTADWRAANPETETGTNLLDRLVETRRNKWASSGKSGPFFSSRPAFGEHGTLLPEKWVWATVDQLANVVRGASPRPAGDPRYFGGDIPWITVGSITATEDKFLDSTPTGVTRAGRDASRYIEAGTLLLTNSGATLGVPKITRIGGCINDGSVALLDVEEPVKSYLYYFLKTQTPHLRSMNQGAAQPNLNTSIVKAIQCPLPPIDEMVVIVRLLDDLSTQAVADSLHLNAMADAPASLRQSILAAAFRGELVA